MVNYSRKLLSLTLTYRALGSIVDCEIVRQEGRTVAFCVISRAFPVKGGSCSGDRTRELEASNFCGLQTYHCPKIAMARVAEELIHMGDFVRCASYKRGIIYGCRSGHEHQIIDFFDPRGTRAHWTCACWRTSIPVGGVGTARLRAGITGYSCFRALEWAFGT